MSAPASARAHVSAELSRAREAHRVALEALEEAEALADETRRRAEFAARESLARAGALERALRARSLCDPYVFGLIDSARVHAEHARAQAGRLEQAERWAAELRRVANTRWAGYLAALEQCRSHPQGAEGPA